MSSSRLAGELEPLRALPRLTSLGLYDCRGVLDLRPLAALEGLHLTVTGGAEVLGAGLFPPERLRVA
ncbi:hypothetical protein [Streptomyces sp. NPDC097619]|uniref:hypothetical protein n=1 Tax=Streptomyces sp. NPDC097619 TaxID=3157228 RepID=UPI0033195F7C